MTTDTLPDWIEKHGDEEGIVVSQPHKYRLVSQLGAVGLLIAGGLGLLVFDVKFIEPVAQQVELWKPVGGLLLAGLVVGGYQYAEHQYTKYIVTTKRVGKKESLLRKRWDPLHHSDLVDVESQTPLLKRVFNGSGDIMLKSRGGTDSVDIVFRDIPDADAVGKTISRQITKDREEARDRGNEGETQTSTDDTEKRRKRMRQSKEVKSAKSRKRRTRKK